MPLTQVTSASNPGRECLHNRPVNRPEEQTKNVAPFARFVAPFGRDQKKELPSFLRAASRRVEYL